jgi:hypothetical protein
MPVGIPRRECAPEEIRDRVMFQIRLGPVNVPELAHFTKLEEERIATAVQELRSAGEVSILTTSRLGGPFYAMPGEVEPPLTDWLSFFAQARDYGGQIYDSGEAPGEAPL